MKKIAIIHEWLESFSGAEKVLSAIIRLLKNTDIFCVVNFLTDENKISILDKKETTATFIQKLPFAKKYFRLYFPFIYFAIRQLNLKEYDVIITSSHAFAHSIKKKKKQIHVCYCHTPMRYIWDLRDLYFNENGFDTKMKSFFPKLLAKKLRYLDYKTAQDVNFFIANSKTTQNRIFTNYKRKSIVIYPPVDINKFNLKVKKQNYYFTASRFVSYKKLDIIVSAFSKMPDKQIIICGEGKYKKQLKDIATRNITIISFQPDNKYRTLMENAKAFVFAAEEDFGIVMAEAQACGTPVIAYNRGGASEIVKHKKTGLLYEHQTAECLAKTITEFEKNRNMFNAYEIRENSERFSLERFNKEFNDFAKNKI